MSTNGYHSEDSTLHPEQWHWHRVSVGRKSRDIWLQSSAKRNSGISSGEEDSLQTGQLPRACWKADCEFIIKRKPLCSSCTVCCVWEQTSNLWPVEKTSAELHLLPINLLDARTPGMGCEHASTEWWGGWADMTRPTLQWSVSSPMLPRPFKEAKVLLSLYMLHLIKQPNSWRLASLGNLHGSLPLMWMTTLSSCFAELHCDF